MSHVSTVTIISGAFHNSEDENVEKLNKYFEDSSRMGNPIKRLNSEIEQVSAGTKDTGRSFFIGGFNYLDHQEFIDFFRSLNWENAVLIIGYQDEDMGFIITPSKGNDGINGEEDCNIKFITKWEY